MFHYCDQTEISNETNMKSRLTLSQIAKMTTNLQKYLK